MAAKQGQRLLDIRGAAAFLGISERTLRRLIWSKRLAFVKVGRLVRVDVQDLEAFISRSKSMAVEIIVHECSYAQLQEMIRMFGRRRIRTKSTRRASGRKAMKVVAAKAKAEKEMWQKARA